MADSSAVITRVDANHLADALTAGIANVLRRRDYINSINVFPVPDSDTGTNLAFTLISIRAVLSRRQAGGVNALMAEVADAAINGARGNSGAIIAQYFQGFSDHSANDAELNARQLAEASSAAARSAWGAMSQPVPGTLPTVLEDFADELAKRVDAGLEDLRELFWLGLKRARRSLAGTPEQLPVLKKAGVVDAGAQGFVDLLEGVWRYIRSGRVPAMPEGASQGMTGESAAQLSGEDAPSEHRFCTECLIEGEAIDVPALRGRLEDLDASSLVVAGGARRARVHIHTDAPGELFRICAEYGEIRQQKADDMTRQHGLMNQRGQVAIVTDSAADLPGEELDRLGIHVVPVRLTFEDEEFLDKLTITPKDFYARLATSHSKPQTSQPPPADFRRQFELLTSHGLDVLAIQISSALSGTWQASKTAAERLDPDRIRVFDSLNGACGQGLMVLWAAEAAARGWQRDDIIRQLDTQRDQYRTFALVRDLSWGVRGGRVKPWMETLSRRLALHPILHNNKEGKLGACGVIAGKRNVMSRFGSYVLKRMEANQTYRVLISHTNAAADAQALRAQILAAHPQVAACWIEEASPAIGVHAGPGSLLLGLQPWEPPEQRHA
ncbi:MAG: DegV family protein [Wenzhouxiangella sp.]